MQNGHTAYVCMGSNLGDTEGNLHTARALLAASPDIAVEAASPIYFTEPQLVREQPWFANQILRLSCAPSMTALTCLERLLAIEQQMGRVRAAEETPTDPNSRGFGGNHSPQAGSQGQPAPQPASLRYGPRVIDLDLLLYDQETWETERLTLPHPRLAERAFVLVPLRDLAPNLILQNGATVDETLRSLVHTVEGNRILQ